MKVDKKAMRLYVVTDRTWLDENTLQSQVEQAIVGGATFIQLREKNLEYESFLKLAKEVKQVTDKHKIPFVINDNIEIAIACKADGAHIGQSDTSVKESRIKIGKDKILGVSVQTVKQALIAQENGADYLGVGAVFKTNTKSDANDVDIETLRKICEAVNIPVVAIGGINKDNVLKLRESKVDGIAVISAIFSKENIELASKELRVLSDEMVNNYVMEDEYVQSVNYCRLRL
ncbi:thiamine phosphate synthase [Clostridiaceae bacterium M8S5]|nr:thiamine phosphate synthase [Clostridiaceae bacterium M8S5]